MLCPGRIKLPWEQPRVSQQTSLCELSQDREAAGQNELTASAGTVKSRLHRLRLVEASRAGEDLRKHQSNVPETRKPEPRWTV